MSEHDFQTEVLERMSQLEEQFQATKELTIIGGIIFWQKKKLAGFVSNGRDDYS